MTSADISTVSESDVHDKRGLSDAESANAPQELSGWKRTLSLRSSLLAAVVLLSVGFVGWRLYADQLFWRAAWEQGTLFPEH